MLEIPAMLQIPSDIADLVFEKAAQEEEWHLGGFGPMTYVEVEGVGYTVQLHFLNRYALTYVYDEENTSPTRGAVASATQQQALALAVTAALGDSVSTAGLPTTRSGE